MGRKINKTYTIILCDRNKKLSTPTFREEKKLWQNGYDFVIGVDEVGRGAFAGSVTVGAVVFDKNKKYVSSILSEINDSKLLKSRKRLILSKEIKKHALHWSIATIGVSTINKKGIGKATEMAFKKAIKKLLKKVHLGGGPDRTPREDHYLNNKVFLLVDGFHIRYIRGIGLKNQKAIIKGDQKSISIASASIIAKVHRDNLMKKLHKKFLVYNFAKNKGYGTKEHQLAIKSYGLSKMHRTSFGLEKFTVST